MSSDEYRRGFIDGAVQGGIDYAYAHWAAQHDLRGARELRDTANGDPVMLKNMSYFVREARMWNQIARQALHRDRD